MMALLADFHTKLFCSTQIRVVFRLSARPVNQIRFKTYMGWFKPHILFHLLCQELNYSTRNVQVQRRILCLIWLSLIDKGNNCRVLTVSAINSSSLAWTQCTTIRYADSASGIELACRG